MTAARLIKLSPNIILLAFAAYGSYTLQAALPGAAEDRAELAKGIDLLLEDIASSDPAGMLKRAALRDPFRPVLPPAPVVIVADDAAKQPGADEMAELVASLQLDATFLQGRDQMAIINGRIYRKGQRLVLPGDAESQPELTLLFVKPMSVLLRGGGKDYFLGYPEQLGKRRDADNPPDGPVAEAAVLDPAGQAAMFQQLLNSPLGALGKSLIRVPDRSKAGSRRGPRRNPAGSR
jgi:hypothetical protein